MFSSIKISCLLIYSLVVTGAFVASRTTEKDSEEENSISTTTDNDLDLSPMEKVELAVIEALVKRSTIRTKEEDDGTPFFQRIRNSFNRVASGSYDEAIKAIFGIKDTKGDQQGGLFSGVLNSPWIKPINKLMQGGSVLEAPKTNGTTKATTILPKTSPIPQNEEENDEEEEEE